MPTFELSGPDGGTYQIEADTAAGAVGALSSMFKQPDASGDSSLAGIGKSLGIGAAEGAISLAGLPGDVGSLVGQGVDYAGSKLGFDPNSVQRFKDTAKSALRSTPAGVFQAPGSSDIKSGIEGMTGQFYKPQGVAEDLAYKVGEFLPAMIGGPESLGAKALTRVVAPAIGSEIGKQVAGPAGEIIGGLAGAGGATAGARKFQEMVAAKRAVPTAEATISAAKGQFKAAEDMNLTVTPDFATNAAAKMRADLKGFDPEAQGVVFKAADRLENLGKPTAATPFKPVEMNEVELIRKQLTNLKQSADAPTREAARRAIASLQESQLAVAPAQTLRGNASDYVKAMSDAIGNYAAGKRSNTVMGKVALGDLNAATAGSGANEDNALRQAIKQLVRPVNNDIVPKASRLGFNAKEIEAMNKVARGTVTGNTARYLGKLAPTGSVSGIISAGAGAAAAGPAGAIALPAVGYLAKKIGDMSTKRAVEALDQLVRSRSPLAQKVAASLPPAVVSKLPKYSKLLLATASLRPIVSPQLVPQDGQ